jgi:hypothetical protein
MKRGAVGRRGRGEEESVRVYTTSRKHQDLEIIFTIVLSRGKEEKA